MDSYILVFAGLLLTAGSLSDRFGRRRVLIIGLAIFGVASLLATWAGSPEQLIAGRVLMGIGGALLMPSTLSILITVFDDEERPKAMAAWGSVAMLGLVGGPILGGALISWFWWGAAFLINVPVAALAIVAAIVLMPESKGPARRPDPLGTILSVVGMTSLVYAIIEWPKEGLTAAPTLIAFAVAASSLVTFVIWELRTDSPMVPLALFRDRNFSGGSLSLTLVQIGNGGVLLVLTQYLQYVQGYSPTKAGLAFTPMAIAALASNSLSPSLSSKFGFRTVAVTGLAIVAAGFGMLATLDPGDGFIVVATALFVGGLGGGLAMPAMISALMAAIPAEHAGVGSAMNDTIQQAGAALGIAVLGSVVTGSYTSGMPDDAPAAASKSIADALATGNPAIATAARQAFTDAMGIGFTVAACGALAAVVLALVVLRGREATPAEAAAETEPAPQPAAAH
jgi:EmrB/QacA subfamily drug resistance transporter